MEYFWCPSDRSSHLCGGNPVRLAIDVYGYLFVPSSWMLVWDEKDVNWQPSPACGEQELYDLSVLLMVQSAMYTTRQAVKACASVTKPDWQTVTGCMMDAIKLELPATQLWPRCNSQHIITLLNACQVFFYFNYTRHVVFQWCTFLNEQLLQMLWGSILYGKTKRIELWN